MTNENTPQIHRLSQLLNKNTVDEKKFSQEEITKAFGHSNYFELTIREKIIVERFFKECDYDDYKSLQSVYSIPRGNVKKLYLSSQNLRTLGGVAKVWDRPFGLTHAKRNIEIKTTLLPALQNFLDQKKYKELDIYINQLGQSTVIIEDKIADNQFLNDFKADLNTKHKVAYVDFRNIQNATNLAEQLLEQYILLFDKPVDTKLPQDTYYAVDFTLDLFTQAEKTEENIIIWMDNFTDIFLLDKDWLFGLLRGVFQHHKSIVHIFTSDSKDKINQIFLNYDNPFFRFARILL